MQKIHKDFHGALSCGFAFVSEKYGRETLKEFLKQAGENIYKELLKKIKKEGLAALEEHWKHIFTIEEGNFKIKRKKNDKELILEIKKCPALEHMKKVKYKIYEDFCLQCKVINSVIAEKIGYKSEVISHQDKNSCIQKIWREE